MSEKYYSITAYKISVKDREKGIGGVQLADLQDYTCYHNCKRLISDFMNRVRSKLNDSNRFMELTSEREIANGFQGFDLICAELRYGGTNGSSFSVLHGNTEHNYSPEDKIVRNYTVYFLFSDDKAYLIALRVGVCSCKTAIEKEFYRLVDKGNIITSILPISNNEYLKRMYKDCSFSSISYETLYKEDDGDPTREKTRKKETFSSVSISLTSERARKALGFAGKLVDLFSGTVKTDVLTQIKSVANDNNYELDEDSLRLEIVVNGTKRIVNFSNLNCLMYDVDITNQLRFDDSNKIETDSLDEIVCDYMRGIMENDE